MEAGATLYYGQMAYWSRDLMEVLFEVSMTIFNNNAAYFE